MQKFVTITSEQSKEIVKDLKVNVVSEDGNTIKFGNNLSHDELIKKLSKYKSEMGESTEFLKYISIFTLADIRNVIINESINPLMIVLTIGLTAIFMILTVMHYEKKELV